MTIFDSRDLIDNLANRDEWDEDDIEGMEELLSEIGDEARYGETVIPVDEFEDYAKELADGIGAINGEETWPLNFIDWPAAAEALKADYTLISTDKGHFAGEYYVRAS